MNRKQHAVCNIQSNVPTSKLLLLFFKTSRCLFIEHYRNKTTGHNKTTTDCISYLRLVITNIFQLLNTMEINGCCTVFSQCLLHQFTKSLQSYPFRLWVEKHPHIQSTFQLLLFSFTLQGCRGALQNRHKNQIMFMLEVVRDKCLHRGERSSRALRHVLSRPSCPPLISTAWICKPVCSLRAQVSPVCPQISFVIRRTPCSSSAAPFNGTVVFMFVKLFTGTALNHVVSSNVGAWPLIPPLRAHSNVILFIHLWGLNTVVLLASHQRALSTSHTWVKETTSLIAFSPHLLWNCILRAIPQTCNTIVYRIDDTVKSSYTHRIQQLQVGGIKCNFLCANVLELECKAKLSDSDCVQYIFEKRHLNPWLVLLCANKRCVAKRLV